MYLLTEKARLACDHDNGTVAVEPTQTLVTIANDRVLVETDPEGRSISGCPNVAPGIKACGLTLKVREGYSDLLCIEGRRICLDTVTGLTDGTPPGAVTYTVRDPGQDIAGER
ncbi:hypothetical protein B2D07_08390 [Desulfococcus multivorans]|jgi:hypothetical protein|uniref:Uncharacterized protein n=2 Tax=Desulfococcaceae TaxID=2931039 RepID=S7V9A5_DESML|nr:conserved uncharacterized protein [Desulfococcus multivorans]AQV00783.1 hypothetical protein B2D07_08390 [Desulfococcus multivorans]EPR43254.1 hypothetical protein dsmv_1280 [Desulfococcus multivorans DSM 2059]SJZ41273.1 hypothetical protein SAMN02745446_00396 [Desulfococcus multivorans DSM 2059]